MEDTRARKAANGKSYSAGGMNVDEIIKYLKSKKISVPSGASRTHLNQLLTNYFSASASASATASATASAASVVYDFPSVPQTQPIPKSSTGQKYSKLMSKAQAEAKRLFTDRKQQQEYIDDYMALAVTDLLPSAPGMGTVPDFDPILTDNCKNCRQYIIAKKANRFGKHDKGTFYRNMSEFCKRCFENIETQATRDKKLGKSRTYRKYHKQNIPDIDHITGHGGKDLGYNDTMYQGAKHWHAVANKYLV